MYSFSLGHSYKSNLKIMRNTDPLQTLQLKLALVAGGHQVTLTPEEAELYGVKETDILTEPSGQEAKDGGR